MKNSRKKSITTILAIIIVTLLTTSCGNSNKRDDVSTPNIVGEWSFSYADVDGVVINKDEYKKTGYDIGNFSLQFFDNGECKVNGSDAKYLFADGKMTIKLGKTDIPAGYENGHIYIEMIAGTKLIFEK